MYRAITQTSTVEAICDQLRSLILNKEILAGERLPAETGLMKLIGVSRPALREAVRVLVGEGLLEVVHGKGTFVREITPANAIHPQVLSILIQSGQMEEILEVRQILEPEIMARVVMHADEKDLQTLENLLLETEERIRQGESVFEITWQFHKMLAQLAGNSAIAQIISILYEMIKNAQRQIYDQHFFPEDELRSHRLLLTVIRSGNIDQARQAMLAHLAKVNEKTTIVIRSEAEDE